MRSVFQTPLICVFTLWAAAGLAAPAASDALTPAQVAAIIHKVDDARRVGQDLTERMVIEESLGDQRVVREGLIYERADESSMVTLFTAPKTVAGSGFLRVDRNLFSYDPALGQWERRTDRDRLAGTNVRRSDLTMVPLADEYDATDGGVQHVGDATLRMLVLKAKPGVEVSFPMLHLWVDQNDRERKREEFGESGKLLRTSYVVKPIKVFSKARNMWIYLPGEIRMVDAIEKNRQTVMVIKGCDLTPIPPSTFTKAWLESKSR